MNTHLYAMIMAGGGGTRLWPLSRRNRPKQSLSLVSDKSMFRVSVERLLPILPLERILVVTAADQVEGLRQDMPELPAENFIVEPSARDNGPAAGLGIVHILQRDPEAVIAYLPSDHHIADEVGFRQALSTAAELAEQDYIVTLGISPSFPSTAFGYIKRGDFIEKRNELDVYRSAGFREKPNTETAMEFIMSGQYSWNAGMFIWRGKQALAEFERQQPLMHQTLTTIQQAIGTPDYQTVLDTHWGTLTKIAIDYAVMEHAENMVVLPVDIGWSDIGNWAALYEVLSSDYLAQATANGHHDDAASNIRRGNGELISVDSAGTLVLSEKMVVTIGLKDVVIVDTDDVLLVCHRDHAQDVRRAVDQIKEIGKHSIL